MAVVKRFDAEAEKAIISPIADGFDRAFSELDRLQGYLENPGIQIDRTICVEHLSKARRHLDLDFQIGEITFSPSYSDIVFHLRGVKKFIGELEQLVTAGSSAPPAEALDLQSLSKGSDPPLIANVAEKLKGDVSIHRALLRESIVSATEEIQRNTVSPCSRSIAHLIAAVDLSGEAQAAMTPRWLEKVPLEEQIACFCEARENLFFAVVHLRSLLPSPLFLPREKERLIVCTEGVMRLQDALENMLWAVEDVIYPGLACRPSDPVISQKLEWFEKNWADFLEAQQPLIDEAIRGLNLILGQGNSAFVESCTSSIPGPDLWCVDPSVAKPAESSTRAWENLEIIEGRILSALFSLGARNELSSKARSCIVKEFRARAWDDDGYSPATFDRRLRGLKTSGLISSKGRKYFLSAAASSMAEEQRACRNLDKKVM